jgi:hypothetical protein
VQRPVDTPPPIIPPEMNQQYPPTNQPPYQYDPSSLNQFGYPPNQGPGPYGWNPGYGGPPFNYSNFSNALMQGMGGGGYANGMMDYGGMPQMQNFLQGVQGGMGGGYGWPEQNMCGYGMSQMMPQMQDFIQGMGGGNPYGNSLMQMPSDFAMGYGGGMGGYGMDQQMMGYY